MSKVYALVDLSKREVARNRRGAVILHRGLQPPHDLPKGFRRDHGFSWEIVETEINRQHKGEPLYVLQDSQKGIVTRIVGETN
jgi:hypothetical protein